MLKTAERGGKLLVVNFSSPETCPHCVHYAPVFAELAEEFKEVMFAVVDASSGDEVFKMEKVTGVPTTRMFVKGVQQADVAGNNGPRAKSEIQRLLATLHKMKHNAPPPIPSADAGPPKAYDPPGKRDTGGRGPNISQLTEAEKPRAIAQRPGGGNDDDEEEDKGSETDFWAALEEACAGYLSFYCYFNHEVNFLCLLLYLIELGWPLEKIKAMLEDEANFPPPEIMSIIQRKTGAKSPSKVKTMLQQQRGAVLEKIKVRVV